MDGRSVVRVLRRALALALALVALWAAGLTAGRPSASELLSDFSSDPALAVGVLAQQLGVQRPDGLPEELGFWGRFFLRQSPYLEHSLLTVDSSPEREAEPAPSPPPRQEAEQADADDRQELWLDPVSTAQEKIVEHTGTAGRDDLVLPEKGLALKNVTGQSVDLAALAGQKVGLDLGEGPQILIYHTHGSEAYTQTPAEQYIPSDPYRTTDCSRNVVRVGEEMAKVFRSQGFQVIHDPTLYDYPAYNGSYGRSRAGVEKWLAEYPTIRFALDVHRDALVGQEGEAYKFVTEERGEKMAQVMLVVGSDDSGAAHPRWRENLALALRLQMALSGRYEHLARPVTLRSTRFNQDLAPGILLVEVGGHGNTLGEAVKGAKLFAKTTGAVLKELAQQEN